jgi:hypothetical protein
LSQTTTTPTSNGNNPGGSVIADPSLFKPAPKKNILFRAVSQNDSLTAENNHSKPEYKLKKTFSSLIQSSGGKIKLFKTQNYKLSKF